MFFSLFRAFFRYFKVDLDSTCPFWQEAGQCSMEGCSVCPCDEDEIPKPWLEWDGKQGKNKEEYGWISFTGLDNTEEDESLGKISVAEGEERDLRLDGMYNDPINSMNNVVEIDIGTNAGIQSEPDEDFDDTGKLKLIHTCIYTYSHINIHTYRYIHSNLLYANILSPHRYPS